MIRVTNAEIYIGRKPTKVIIEESKIKVYLNKVPYQPVPERVIEFEENEIKEKLNLNEENIEEYIMSMSQNNFDDLMKWKKRKNNQELWRKLNNG